MGKIGNKINDLPEGAPVRALKQYFGFEEFRPGQQEVVEAVLRGGPVVAVMPTGAGKSLCYQLPAVISEKTVLVVSPLISLMKDQVDALVARNIPATYINSQLNSHERHVRLENAKEGKYRLIYVAPERFRHDNFVENLKRVPLGGMAIDEAHCISQWGHDFRPDYLKLSEVISKLAIPQVCATTATATPEVLDDISRALALENPQVFVYGFRRRNLVLRVIPIVRMRDKVDHVVDLAQHVAGSGIVYAATRKHVEEIACALLARGLTCDNYHAGMDESDRDKAQDRFMNGDSRIMVATNAFGMGIDKHDVRFVVHYDLPGSVEAYYQEAGRAGRDGALSECVILFSYADVKIHEFFISRFGVDNPDADPRQVEIRRHLEKTKLKRMVRYCYAEGCRHVEILGYFGDKERAEVPCSVCDNCQAEMKATMPRWARARVNTEPVARTKRRETSTKLPVRVQDRQRSGSELDHEQTITLQKILSAVARSRGRLNTKDLIALMCGVSQNLPIDLQNSRSFGVMSGAPPQNLQNVLLELTEQGVLYRSARDCLELTHLGVAVMRGEKRLGLTNPDLLIHRVGSGELSQTKDGGELGVQDAMLLDLLKKTRIEAAKEDGVPAFVVAHNSLLVRLAQIKPVSPEQLLAVKGIGPVLARRYGNRFIETIRDFLHSQGNDREGIS
ncbi:MAG: ATP-dependent DNA helicase RecQ [Myxococcales bacterium]|nr:ATP-dependent DNA helicase RecQ [Myxococcales bacterium]